MYNFAAIDFETAHYRFDSACALGVVFVRDGRVVDSKRHLIRPPTEEFRFTGIHGLTWEDVKDSPTFAEVWRTLDSSLTDLDFLAAHWASFDRRVLNACCESHGLRPPDHPFVCTVRVARSVWNIRPTRLPDMCRHLDVPLTHHEAGSDAMACAQIVLAAAKRGWRPS